MLVQDTAEPSPEFPEITFHAAANSISEQHLNQGSNVRILLLSHARKQSQGTTSICDTKGPRTGWKNAACPECAAQGDRCDTSRSGASSRLSESAQDGTLEACASCLPTHVPFQWHCTPLSGPVSARDNVYQSHRESIHRKSNSMNGRHSGALPTIRESRSFRNSARMSDDSPTDFSDRGPQVGGHAEGGSPFRDGSGQSSSSSTAEFSGALADGERPISAKLLVEEEDHCTVQLEVTPPSVRQNSTPNNGPSTDGNDTNGAQEHRQMPSNSQSDSTSAFSTSASASSFLCTWELRALNPQDAACLVDASLDLGIDLTPVPMPFSSLHCCSVLPRRTVMLGLENATQVSGTRHAIVSSGVQPAALFLHPQLPEDALQQFIEDNKRTTKVRNFSSIYGCSVGFWIDHVHHVSIGACGG